MTAAPPSHLELLYICTLPFHQYNLECCKIFCAKISVKIIPVYKSHLFIKQWNVLCFQAGAVANARATVCSVPSDENLRNQKHIC